MRGTRAGATDVGGNGGAWTPVDLERAMTNVRDAYRHFAEGFPAGRSETDGNLLLIDSGTSLTELNIAFVTGRGAGLAAALRKAAKYFADRGLPWRLEAGESLGPTVGRLAAALGLSEPHHRPGLLCHAPFEGMSRPPKGATVRRVRSPSEATIFAHVLATGTGFDPPPELFDVPFHRLPDMRAYLAFVGDAPAACSLLHLQGGFAGVYAVATIDAFRRQGLARAVTSESLHDALAEGYRASCLQASTMGLPVYLGMGFQPVFDDVTWSSPDAGPDLAAPPPPTRRRKS